MSSVVGRIVNPFGGVYASSKWALEALAEASSYELAPFGIDVAIVEPGAFPTEILGKVGTVDDTARAASYGEFARIADTAPARIAARAQGNDPADVAQTTGELSPAPASGRCVRLFRRRRRSKRSTRHWHRSSSDSSPHSASRRSCRRVSPRTRHSAQRLSGVRVRRAWLHRV